ncbi:MAG: signal peptidase I [bacterium]
MSKKLKREIYSWIIVILVVLVLRATFVEAMVIPTPSMEKTLLIGDALLVNRFIYGVKIPVPFTNRQIPIIPGSAPKRGHIIAFLSPLENKNIVKRCIAIAGDTVEIINKTLYVNGRRIDEPYVVFSDYNVFQRINVDQQLYQKTWQKGELYDILGVKNRDNFGPVVVPKDHIFAMGDNRDDSFDSRFWGPLHEKYLLGKPLFVFFSLDPGEPAQNLVELLRFWKWKAIRFIRIGMVI